MIDENVVKKSINFCLQMRQVIVFLLAYRCFSFRCCGSTVKECCSSLCVMELSRSILGVRLVDEYR